MPISLKAGMGGGGGLPKLAPDLSHLLANQTVALVTSQTTEQLALGLTGKFAISALALQTGNTWPAGNIGVRLVVDGETIWNGNITTAAGNIITFRLHGLAFGNINTNYGYPQEFAFCCENSLQLYITVPPGASSTSLALNYNARPIK